MYRSVSERFAVSSSSNAPARDEAVCACACVCLWDAPDRLLDKFRREVR
jgi:hypothetical protein